MVPTPFSLSSNVLISKVCRLLAVAVLAIMASSLGFAQTDALSLESGAGPAGSTVALNLLLSGTATGGQPASFQFTLSYDPVDFSSVSVSAGAVASSAGKSISCNTASGSTVCIVWGLNNTPMGDGVVAVVSVGLSAGSSKTSRPILVTQPVASCPNGNEIPLTAAGASVQVTAAVPPPVVSALSCTPSSFTGAGSASCTVTLSAAAPSGGASVALSDDSASVTTPASVTVAAGATTATFTATVAAVSSDATARITASLNGTSASASLSLAAPAVLSALSCNPTTLAAGAASTCTVTLTKAAPSGGFAVTLSDNSSWLSVPSSVTVAANSSSATFTATAGAPSSAQTVTITASANGVSATAMVTVQAQLLVSALSCSPTSFTAAGSSACTVSLSAAAPTSGAAVALASSHASLTAPASVTFAAGQTSASFTANAAAVTADATAVLTATLNGSSATTTFALAAPAALSSLACSPSTLTSGSSATCTVGLTKVAPSAGYPVSLSASSPSITVPASVTVPSGSTSASFTAAAGTVTASQSVTLTASGSPSVSTTLTIQPVATPQLSALSCTPTTITAGASAACTVSLTAAALSGGATVALASSSGSLAVPGSVTVPAGTNSASFTATASSVTAQTTAQVTATYNGAAKSVAIQITAAVSTGPVAAYGFNEGAGASVADSSGNANNGLLSGVSWAAGKYGSALSFNGTAGNVSIPHSPSLNLTSSFTLSAWIKPAALNGYQTVLIKEADGGCGYWLQTAGNQISSGFHNGSSCAEHATSTANLQVGNWYHIAGVFDDAANTYTIYLNGIPIATQAETGTPLPNTQSLVLGQTAFAGGAYERWNGLVDDVRIYNRALSQAEIQADMNTPIGGSAPPPVLPVPSSLTCTPATFTAAGSAACTVTLSAAAPAGGASVALSDNSSSVTVPASVTVAAGATSATFTATVAAVTADATAQITATLNGASRTATLTLVAPASLASLACSPSTVLSGSSTTCTVSLTKAAPGNGYTVSLSDNSPALTVPASVTVPAGAASAAFTATAAAVGAEQSAQITAAYNGVTKSVTITLKPAVIMLTALSCTPSTIQRSQTTRCTLALSPAPPANTSVKVTSSYSRFSVPNPVVVPAGSSSVSFTGEAGSRAQARAVTVTATLGSSSVTTTVNIVTGSTSLNIDAPLTQTSVEGETVRFQVSAHDADDLPVTLAASRLPAGAVFDSAQGEFSWEPRGVEPGSYEVAFVATNSAGESAGATVVVEVMPEEPVLKTLLHAATRSAGRACSPGSLAALQGSGLRKSSSDEEVRVWVNGEFVPVLEASAREITFQCPDLAPGTPLNIRAQRGERWSNFLDAVMDEPAPGVFTLDRTGSGQGLVSLEETRRLAMFRSPRLASQPAVRRDRIAILATGLGAEPDAGQLQVAIGDTVAQVESVAAQAPGLWRVIARIPDDAAIGESVPLRLLLNRSGRGLESNTVTIAIEAAGGEAR